MPHLDSQHASQKVHDVPSLAPPGEAAIHPLARSQFRHQTSFAVRTSVQCGLVAQTLDVEPVGIVRGGVQPGLLRRTGGGETWTDTRGVPEVGTPATSVPRECLTSDLLSVRCPLSGGVDYGTVWFDYTGTPICRRALLAYVLSYRDSAMLIEQCVETIFADVLAQLSPARLAVGARFTRRYGLDINPVRSTHAIAISNLRTVRQ